MSKVSEAASEAAIESDKSWENASLKAIQQARETVCGFNSVHVNTMHSPPSGNSGLTFEREASHERLAQRFYRNKGCE